MPNLPNHIDKPEPRWQALLAFVAVGILALPRSLVIGPVWLLPTLILLLLVPTVVSHRAGRRQLNRFLGILISSITTLALVASVILLVRALPLHKEDASSLLLSGGELWLTNVLVFALWYWRLDGGDQLCATNVTNLAAAVFFSRKCRSKKRNGRDLPAHSGARILRIIFSSLSRKARPSVPPTRRSSPAGRRFSPDSGFHLAQHRYSTHLTRRRRAVVPGIRSADWRQ